MGQLSAADWQNSEMTGVHQNEAGQRGEKGFEMDSEANSEPLKGGLVNPNIKNIVLVGTRCNKDM